MAGLKTALALAAAFVTSTLAQPAGYLQCGDAYYSTDKYVCYNDASLCPVFYGVPDLLCGPVACYTDYQYSCTDGELHILPPVDSPFYLVAINPDVPAINNQPIQAAGLHFYVGGSPGTYCPTVVGSICSTFPNNLTVFYGGGSALDVEVPGGQETYVQTNGAPAFEQAHSISFYNLSSYGLGPTYQGGAMFGPGSTNWLACPTTYENGNTTYTNWQAFFQLPGLTFADDCVGFYAKVVNLPSGTVGAWQYI